jgi:hypothetical protein
MFIAVHPDSREAAGELNAIQALEDMAAQARVSAVRADLHHLMQVRFRRDRFPPTCDLGYRAAGGAVGLGYRFTVYADPATRPK